MRLPLKKLPPWQQLPRWQTVHADTILCTVLAAVVLLVNLLIVPLCSHPFVFNDEAGYWTNAAIFNGKDWSGVSNGLVWYSYGYSFWLALLMRFCSDAALLYQSALVLNALMLVGVYFLNIQILQQLFPNLKRTAVYFAAFAAVLYTPFQVQSGIAWSETTILLVYTLIAYMVLRSASKPTCPSFLLLGILNVYLYMVHNRCIGVIAAAALIVLLQLIFKTIKFRHAAVFFATLGIGMVVHMLIKSYLSGIIWIGEPPAGNDAGSVIQNAKAIVTSISGLKTFISLLFSQSFAGVVSALCLPLAALTVIVTKSAESIVGHVKALRAKQSDAKPLPAGLWLHLFLFCAFAATLVISSMFMLHFTRIDHVLYTRYYDMTIGLFVGIGLCSMVSAISRKKAAFLFCLIPVFLLLGANRAEVLMHHVSIDVFNTVCAPGIASLYNRFDRTFFAYAFAAIVPMGCMTGCVLFFRKRKTLALSLAATLCAASFLLLSGGGRDQIKRSQAAGYEDGVMLEQLEGTDSAYIMKNCDVFMQFCQFHLMDTKMQAVADIGQAAADAYVIANAADWFRYSDYDIVDHSNSHMLFVNRPAAEQDFRTLPLSFMYTFDEHAYLPEEDAIVSTGNPYLCYGPYFQIDAGDYTFQLDLSAGTIGAETVGYAEFRSSTTGTVYDRVELTADLLQPHSRTSIALHPTIAAASDNIEIIVFLHAPDTTELQLHEILYKKEK